MPAIEARFLRRGDVLDRNGKRRTIKRTRTRKSDNTITIVWLDDSTERLLGEDLIDVVRRDVLTFPAGPGGRAYGR